MSEERQNPHQEIKDQTKSSFGTETVTAVIMIRANVQ
jgi:hypothetical protein